MSAQGARWPRIILASGSPRRREILDRLGLSYEVLVSDVSEQCDETAPERMVTLLASRKAQAVADAILKDAAHTAASHTAAKAGPPEDAVDETLIATAAAPGSITASHTVAKAGPQEDAGDEALIIAADTLVAIDGEVLGKPADTEDSLRMLRRLRGRTHQVYTGVCLLLLWADGHLERDVFCETAQVHIVVLSDEEIRAYVATGEPADKAGSYAIQGIFAKYVSGYEGDFETIKGLPGDALMRHMEEMMQRR